MIMGQELFAVFSVIPATGLSERSVTQLNLCCVFSVMFGLVICLKDLGRFHQSSDC